MEFIISLLIFGAITTGTVLQSEQNETPPILEIQTEIKDEYAFIKMERTPCFGICPSYKLTIYSTGRVEYLGMSNVKKEGSYTTQLSEDELQRLKDKLNEIKYFALKNKYDAQITDIPSCLIYVNNGEQEKKIYDRYGAPKELKDFEKLIDHIVLNKELKKLE